MTREQLLRKFPNASESFIRQNASPVGALVRPEPKPVQRREGQDSGVDQVQASVGYRITITSHRRKLLDAHDNLRSANKPLADRIAEYLGFASDDDPRLDWEYGQVISKITGTIVKIERL